jgi:metal-responsive CopG/Arc/MetJ family transcriptional regulator
MRLREMVRIFCTAVDSEVAEYIDKLAEELGITRSELIRQVLRNLYASRDLITKEKDIIYFKTWIVLVGKRWRK